MRGFQPTTGALEVMTVDELQLLEGGGGGGGVGRTFAPRGP